jgi:hypothetical protein
MLGEVLGCRLRGVERFAWHAEDGSPANPDVGSVHLWFEGGRGVHLDAGGDWSLRWSVSEPGDAAWLGQYAYNWHGRWVIRDAAGDEPFRDVVGSMLTSATPLFNEMDDVVGVALSFGERSMSLSTWLAK